MHSIVFFHLLTAEYERKLENNQEENNAVG